MVSGERCILLLQKVDRKMRPQDKWGVIREPIGDIPIDSNCLECEWAPFCPNKYRIKGPCPSFRRRKKRVELHYDPEMRVTWV